MRSNYDDLMGLDMYDDGMSGLFSADMLKDQLIAAGAAGAAIVASAWVGPKIFEKLPAEWTEPTKHRVTALIGIVGGMAASRALWNYNRDAAMAVLGGVSGLGLAQLLDTYMDAHLLRGYPLGAMPEDSELSASDEALLSYGRNGSALAALEATNINASRGAFSGFADPTVSAEALMGTMVQAETLNGYQPYLS